MNAQFQPPHPAAVLWDLDGTLIDSEPLWLEAEVSMLGRYGLTLSPALREQLIGSGLVAGAELFRGLGVPLSVAEIIAEWADRVSAGIAVGRATWRPGARDLLADLYTAGIPCALVTMSVRSIADTVLSQLPAGSFAAVVAGDEVEHEKPHPDPYLRGAAQLAVEARNCLALEDSVTGIRAARAAGAVTIGVPNLTDISAAPAHELWPTLAGVGAARLSERFRELRHTHQALEDFPRE